MSRDNSTLKTNATIPHRYLGNSGLKVSVLSLGSWLTYGAKVDGDSSLDILKHAYENGVTFFDTAETYASGEAERTLGVALKELAWPRSSYTLSTKIFWGGAGVNQRGLSRKHIIEGTKASLERLQLDYVDVVFAHRPDPETPMEEVVRAFNWVIEKGWAFYWGTSEWSAEQIRDAVGVAERLQLIAPIVEQPEYSMLARERVEKEYARLYDTIKLGLTVWSPLKSGILTGKYNKGIPDGSRLAGNGFIEQMLRGSLSTAEGEAMLEKVGKLMLVAEGLGCSVAQLALAWCVHNQNVSTVILGATSIAQLDENIASLQVVDKLTPDVITEIETILANKPTPARQFR